MKVTCDECDGSGETCSACGYPNDRCRCEVIEPDELRPAMRECPNCEGAGEVEAEDFE